MTNSPYSQSIVFLLKYFRVLSAHLPKTLKIYQKNFQCFLINKSQSLDPPLIKILCKCKIHIRTFKLVYSKRGPDNFNDDYFYARHFAATF